MNFSKGRLILNPAKRKILKERFSKRTPTQIIELRSKVREVKSKSLQNILRGLSKNSLISDVKNKSLPSYYTEYKISNFYSDTELNFRVAKLLNEIIKIKAILYEKSLYWNETKHLEKEIAEKIISNALNHQISKAG